MRGGGSEGEGGGSEGEGRGKEDTHIYMTPEDFLRSITPGVIQPESE